MYQSFLFSLVKKVLLIKKHRAQHKRQPLQHLKKNVAHHKEGGGGRRFARNEAPTQPPHLLRQWGLELLKKKKINWTPKWTTIILVPGRVLESKIFLCSTDNIIHRVTVGLRIMGWNQLSNTPHKVENRLKAT